MAEPTIYKLYLQPGLKLLLALLLIIFVGIGAAITIMPFLIQTPKAPPPLIGGFFLVFIVVYLGWVLSLPHRITFAGDGTIEFISVLRRRTVRADEIKSIKPEGSQLGFFIVRTGHGKIRMLAQFDGFHDFLTRLQALHPVVELRGC
jgi:hypothetical protein